MRRITKLATPRIAHRSFTGSLTQFAHGVFVLVASNDVFLGAFSFLCSLLDREEPAIAFLLITRLESMLAAVVFEGKVSSSLFADVGNVGLERDVRKVCDV